MKALLKLTHLSREQVSTSGVDDAAVFRSKLVTGDVLFGGDSVAGVTCDDGVETKARGILRVHHYRRESVRSSTGSVRATVDSQQQAAATTTTAKMERENMFMISESGRGRCCRELD